MAELTPNLQLVKPTINGEDTENTWGYDLNANFDILDDAIGSAKFSDGDKGDIIVSAQGELWNFDPTVVTAAGRGVIAVDAQAGLLEQNGATAFRKRGITVHNQPPTGGVDGDLWLQYNLALPPEVNWDVSSAFFNTRTEAAASDIPNTVLVIQVGGFAAPGDQRQEYYVRLNAVPPAAPLASFRSVDRNKLDGGQDPTTGGYWKQVETPVNVKYFGTVADGASHPLSTRYASLAAAQAVYPHAIALTDELDWAGVQAAINANPGKCIRAPSGQYVVNRTIHNNNADNTFLRGDGAGSTKFLRSVDYGSTFKWGGRAALTLQGGVSDVWVEDVNASMTFAVSLAHFHFDHCYRPTLANIIMLNGCGFAVLDGVTELYPNNIEAQWGGSTEPVPTHAAVRIRKSTVVGATAPIGAAIHFTNTNINGGFGVGAQTYLLDGFFIEAVDGFSLSAHSHVGYTKQAHIHIKPTGLSQVFNVSANDTLLDISDGYAIFLDGTAQDPAAPEAFSLDFYGARCQCDLLGGPTGVGMYIDTTFRGTLINSPREIEGYKYGAVWCQSPGVNVATFHTAALNCLGTVFYMFAGQDITLIPKSNGGTNALIVGATVRRLKVLGGYLEACTNYGVQVAAGAGASGWIDFIGVAMRGNTAGRDTVGAGANCTFTACVP